MKKIENIKIKKHKTQFDMRYSMGNPFERKHSWKVRPLRSLSLNRKCL